MDSRFPVRYLTDRRVLALSADQFRTWVLATAYSVTNRTDGVIEQTDLQHIPFTTDKEAAGLVAAGLWKSTSKGWKIQDFDTTQTGSAEMERLERRRKAERDKKAKQRAGNQPDVPPGVPGDVPGDKTGDVVGDAPGGVPGDRTGKASARKAQEQGSVLGSSETEDSPQGTGWPEVEQPGAGGRKLAAVPSSDPYQCATCRQGRLRKVAAERGETSCLDCIHHGRATG